MVRMGTKSRLTPLTQALAAEIRAERGARDLTQQDVYEAAGLSRSAYWHIETARRQPDAAQIEAICQALRVAPSELFRRAEVRANRSQEKVLNAEPIEVERLAAHTDAAPTEREAFATLHPDDECC